MLEVIGSGGGGRRRLDIGGDVQKDTAPEG